MKVEIELDNDIVLNKFYLDEDLQKRLLDTVPDEVLLKLIERLVKLDRELFERKTGSISKKEVQNLIAYLREVEEVVE